MQWHEAFPKGHELTEKINNSGQPFTSITEENVNTVATIVREDRHSSIWDLATQVNITKTKLFIAF